MAENIKEWIQRVAVSSNELENTNSDLKRIYLIRNIQAFNYIVSLIRDNQGSFGTGYPFYVLEGNLDGKLPIIREQTRYNNELIRHGNKSQRDVWVCEDCLNKNYSNMPDLKQVCKPCPNMDNELKPRKLLNRLIDLDMWMICKDGDIERVQVELANLLGKFGIKTSDVDPVQTIKDMEEITQQLKDGIMPNKFLPIDAHIIEYSKIKKLIQDVPGELKRAKQENQIPYLPIHPKSYRKTWQYDDEAYNYIYDFLSAFTEFNVVDELKDIILKTRKEVADTYSNEELYEFLLNSATDGNKRRNKTAALPRTFIKRANRWRNIDLVYGGRG